MNPGHLEAVLGEKVEEVRDEVGVPVPAGIRIAQRRLHLEKKKHIFGQSQSETEGADQLALLFFNWSLWVTKHPLTGEEDSV